VGRRRSSRDPNEQWKPGYEALDPPKHRKRRQPLDRLRHPLPARRTDAEPLIDRTATDAVRTLVQERRPILSAEGVVRTYPGPQGVTALRGVTLQAMAGEFVALLGPSGSGKTTLLGLLAGLDQPEDGRVCWLERPMDQLGHDERVELRRSRLGVVFQSFGLLPTLSAVENVELPLRVARADLHEARASATRWLERLGLVDRLENRVFELSAGQQQRVAIARALVIEPDAVLADEPIAEVDSENAELILEALREVSGRGGAVICATHNPAALAYSTRAVLLRDGRIEATGSPDQVAGLLTTD
jgi:putative ABC transport system ATP-binding protein